MLNLGLRGPRVKKGWEPLIWIIQNEKSVADESRKIIALVFLCIHAASIIHLRSGQIQFSVDFVMKKI